jgi:hypothetical protein
VIEANPDALCVRLLGSLVLFFDAFLGHSPNNFRIEILGSIAVQRLEFSFFFGVADRSNIFDRLLRSGAQTQIG